MTPKSKRSRHSRRARRQERGKQAGSSQSTAVAGEQLERGAPSAATEGSAQLDEPLGSIDQEQTTVRALILEGRSREATTRAKALHRSLGTERSEELLAEAYVGRIEQLIDSGMATEARTLIDLARERLPAQRKRIDLCRTALAVRQGDVDRLLGTMAREDVRPQQRAQIDQVLRRWLMDPRAVADCQALPAEHRLRRDAAMVVEALAAVTAGPVTEEQIARATISRRSPFAPWKVLVRALAAFHQHDDDACKQWLGALPAQSAAGRLAPIVLGLMDGSIERLGTRGSAALAKAVHGEASRLRRTLAQLDDALGAGAAERLAPQQQRRAVRAIGDAVASGRKVWGDHPEPLEQLRQRLAVRCMLAKLPSDDVRKAVGKPPLRSSNFWHLLALGLERDFDRDPQRGARPMACWTWAQYRRHALAEGRLVRDGPDDAALLLHMAALLTEAVTPHDLPAMRTQTEPVFREQHAYWYDGQTPSIRAIGEEGGFDEYCLDPEKLFERATHAHPDAEVFERWLSWTKAAHEHWRPRDAVAEAWHQALPDDVRPVLHLMRSAERRGALQKATRYLEQAERLDGLNAAVPRARQRLLIATAQRHLADRKPRLAARDVARITEITAERDADALAFAAALDWCGAVIARSEEEARSRAGRVAELLADPVAAAGLLESVARVCRLDDKRLGDHVPSLPAAASTGELAAAAARLSALGDRMQLPLGIPAGWSKRIERDLRKGGTDLDLSQMRALAEAALRRDERRLAYAATGAALREQGDHTARFLLLRAKALPVGMTPRVSNCLRVAAELARRGGDMALLDEIAQALPRRRSRSQRWREDEALEPLGDAAIGAVLRRERQAKGFPREGSYDPLIDWEATQSGPPMWDAPSYDVGPCDCPQCRAERQHTRNRSGSDRSERRADRQLDLFGAEPLDGVAGPGGGVELKTAADVLEALSGPPPAEALDAKRGSAYDLLGPLANLVPDEDLAEVRERIPTLRAGLAGLPQEVVDELIPLVLQTSLARQILDSGPPGSEALAPMEAILKARIDELVGPMDGLWDDFVDAPRRGGSRRRGTSKRGGSRRGGTSKR